MKFTFNEFREKKHAISCNIKMGLIIWGFFCIFIRLNVSFDENKEK